MPIFRTGADVSLDDLIAQREAEGEHVVQVLPRDGGFTVVTAKDDRRELLTKLGETETR